jgi:hypothetical protein
LVLRVLATKNAKSTKIDTLGALFFAFSAFFAAKLPSTLLRLPDSGQPGGKLSATVFLSSRSLAIFALKISVWAGARGGRREGREQDAPATFAASSRVRVRF